MAGLLDLFGYGGDYTDPDRYTQQTGLLSNSVGSQAAPQDAQPDMSSQAAQAKPDSHWYDNLSSVLTGGNVPGGLDFTPEQKRAAATNALMNLGIGMMKASAPSMDPAHKSFGYALANGLESGQQGYQQSLSQAMANQQNAFKLQQMRAQMSVYNDMMGNGAQGAGTAGTPGASTPGAAASSTASGGAVGGTSAAPGASGTSAQGGQPTNGVGSQYQIPGLNRQQSAALFISNPQEYWKQMGSAHALTDTQKIAADAYGYGTDAYHQAMTAAAQKNAIVPLRAGAGYIGADGQVHYTLPAAPQGYTYNANNELVPIKGGLDAIRAGTAAKAAGNNDQTPYSGYDDKGNPLPVMSTSQALGNPPQGGAQGLPATQNGLPNGAPMSPLQRAVRMVESTNNPRAVSPVGASGTMQTMQDTLTNPGYGVTPAQNNSDAERQRVGNDYLTALQQRYGNDSDALIAYNWGPGKTDKWIANGRNTSALPPDVKNYVGSVNIAMQGLGNQQTAQQAPTVASPPRVFAQPPQGVKEGASAAAQGVSDSMNSQMDALSKSDTNYQQNMTSLSRMRQLAQQENPVGQVGAMLPYELGPRFNASNAEYDKLRASTISTIAPGSMGTNASRATVEESLPGYDRPQSAQLAGIDNTTGQVNLIHAKRQFLNPYFNNKDADAFTKKSAEFDNNVTPQMANTFNITDQNQQRAAIKAQIQANPALGARYQWAFQNGLLAN